MARTSKVELSGLVDVVTELMRTKTTAEIHGILQRDYGWEHGVRPVERFCAKVRSEQGRLNREAIEAAIAPTVGRDIATLDAAIERLAEWFRDDNLRKSERLMVVRELRQVIDTKLRNAGGDGAGKLAKAVAGFADLAARALEPSA